MPDLTVIVAATDASSPLAACLDAIASQSANRDCEFLVVSGAPAACALVREHYPRFTAIEAPAAVLLPDLWGIGVTHAQGRVLALTSGACLPGPGWLEAIVHAHAEYHSAIGGVVDIAPRAGLNAWALYFIRFAAFMPPLPRSYSDVSADNGSYKRAAIADQFGWIKAHGFWDHEVNERLHAAMRSRWRDPAIAVTCARAVGGSRERFHTGIALGRLRAAQFDRRRRIIQLLKSPLLPFVYLARIARTVFRARRHRVPLLLVLPIILWYLACWSAGQAVGLIKH